MFTFEDVVCEQSRNFVTVIPHGMEDCMEKTNECSAKEKHLETFFVCFHGYTDFLWGSEGLLHKGSQLSFHKGLRLSGTERKMGARCTKCWVSSSEDVCLPLLVNWRITFFDVKLEIKHHHFGFKTKTEWSWSSKIKVAAEQCCAEKKKSQWNVSKKRGKTRIRPKKNRMNKIGQRKTDTRKRWRQGECK